MLRPDMVVLGEESIVPESNVAHSAPAELTHELAVDEPYRFDDSDPAAAPDGVLPAGTRVAVLAEGDDRCRVVDGSGLAVDVRRASLRELPGG